MRLKAACAMALLGTLLSGCASVIGGVAQDVQVTSDPQGAKCIFSRRGSQIAVVQSTPETARISLSRRPIDVTCELPGYPTETQILTPRDSGAWDVAYLGGLTLLTFYTWPSAVVDAATGAGNEYRNSLHFQFAQGAALMYPPVNCNENEDDCPN
jgi:hypothetical protein